MAGQNFLSNRLIGGRWDITCYILMDQTLKVPFLILPMNMRFARFDIYNMFLSSNIISLIRENPPAALAERLHNYHKMFKPIWFVHKIKKLKEHYIFNSTIFKGIHSEIWWPFRRFYFFVFYYLQISHYFKAQKDKNRYFFMQFLTFRCRQ